MKNKGKSEKRSMGLGGKHKSMFKKGHVPGTFTLGGTY